MAPRETVRWLAARGARQAVVTVYEEIVGTIGDNSPPRVYSECAFGIVVGPRQLALVVSPPPASREGWKGEIVRYRHRGTVTTLVTRFNTSLDRAGKLRLH